MRGLVRYVYDQELSAWLGQAQQLGKILFVNCRVRALHSRVLSYLSWMNDQYLQTEATGVSAVKPALSVPP
jgi:hypothetical protein